MNGPAYQQQILEQLRQPVTQWVAQLRQQTPDLLLTSQWQVLYPRGYQPGLNTLPVVTQSRQGQYQVAEVSFVLPDSLELDPASLAIDLVSRPYVPLSPMPAAASGDLSLKRLNNLVVQVSRYLQDVLPHSGQPPVFTWQPAVRPEPLESSPPRVTTIVPTRPAARQRLEQWQSLPDWISTLSDPDLRERVLDKLATDLAAEEVRCGHEVSLGPYLKNYTRQLADVHKLHPFCRYKGRPITLSPEGHCQEVYCSKKPYRSACTQATWRLGPLPDPDS